MSAIHETNNLGDLLKYEAPNLYSRDLATIAAGQNLLLGAIVASHALVWPVAITPTEKATAIAQIEARGVLV